MLHTAEYCLTQADSNRRLASEAALDEVRDRFERSAAAWSAMAQRQEAVAKVRADNAARRSLADAEAAAAALPTIDA